MPELGDDFGNASGECFSSGKRCSEYPRVPVSVLEDANCASEACAGSAHAGTGFGPGVWLHSTDFNRFAEEGRLKPKILGMHQKEVNKWSGYEGLVL